MVSSMVRASSPDRHRLPRWRDETAQLLTHARRRIETSRTQIAANLTWLLTHDPPGTPRASVRFDPPELLLRLLDQPCDLDLLLFFHRHRRALLALDDLATRAGYPREQVRESLRVLRRNGFLVWSKARIEAGRTARLYEFVPPVREPLLNAFCWLASSADGRRAVRRALAQRTLRDG